MLSIRQRHSAWLLLSVLCLMIPLSTVAQDLPEEIRVRLLEPTVPQVLTLQSDEGLAFYASNDPDRPLAEIEPREKATLRMRDNEVHVVLEGMAFYALSLQVIPLRNASVTVKVLDGIQPPEPSTYAGRLQIDECGR